ncbi:Nitrate transporter 1.4 [Acorus calamus]|uniref:Nitrate transporter 1.4 n=1 Tax=Acorus calamus TaxID=4465 RepID=A0AAV9E0L5_ACOCL|nr:Nitrate transporter 1.4 [Acorus calamus]
MEKMCWATVADAVDYKGFPADKSKTGGWVSAALILVIEICERLSTMGIAVNLVTYLGGTMHLPTAESANVVTDFMGTAFLLCLLGGFLADSFLGRYKTIAIFAAVQALVILPFTASLAGTGMLAISTWLPQLRPPRCNPAASITGCQRANGLQMGVLYLSLYLIALGTGGLKSSISGFGTDQFDDKDEREKAQKSSFFHRFFFFISTGTLFAVTVLVYIQDEVGRSWAYAICSISMMVAILLFLSGTKRYRYKKTSGSPIVQILQVVVAATRNRKLELPVDPSQLFEDDSVGSTKIPHTDQFRCLDKAAIMVEGEHVKRMDGMNPWRVCRVTRVEEVKMMVRLLPVWATTIMFWTTYAQMITFSVEQATTMNRKIGTFQIPAGSLTVFFVGAILKISIGLALSTIGMAIAAFVEMKRLSVARSVGTVARHADSTLPMSVFVLIPQFFFVGAGEGIIYTGQLDFFITRSPKGMKTISTGLFLTTLALGFFVSSFLVSIVKSVTSTGKDGQGWLADNINNGRLDCFYGLLTVLCLINLVAYLVCAARVKPVQAYKDAEEMDEIGDLGAIGEEKC